MPDQLTGPHARNTRPSGVLVVDDEPLVRTFLAALLRRSGRACWEAASGGEAVAVLARHADEVGVALVDLNLPGLDGRETIAALKRANPGLPCFLMGGDLEEEAAPPADGLLPKPFSLDQVERCLLAHAANL